MVLPVHLGQWCLGLRSGGVDHQHLDGTQDVADSCHQLADLPLVGHVRGKRRRQPTSVPNARGHLDDLSVIPQAVHRYG